ncbi:hypothetical protein ABZV78_06605 [Micromonospora sp. NPDC004540]|uniref:hypothetical protein n=1 Tax=Micromonospora sp. NPDC004540 TaxID=3154457 RepID=UPI0033A01E98
MGYETTFTGQVTITPPLNQHEIDYLLAFAETRHEPRSTGPYALGYGDEVEDARDPDPSKPGYWCKWAPTADGAAIAWNEREKFYDAEFWMGYLVHTFLKQDATVVRERVDPVPGRVYPPVLDRFTFDHVVDGVIEAEGEWPDDRWRIEVRANAVYVVRLLTEPDHAEYPRTHRDDWTDEQRADFAARTRHNFVYLVRDGRLHEVGPADGTSFEPIPADVD